MNWAFVKVITLAVKKKQLIIGKNRQRRRTKHIELISRTNILAISFVHLVDCSFGLLQLRIGRIGMGPLQQSLAKALPPPPSLKAKNHRKKHTKHTTMHWHDNISSYKCFETIATPSPIPIAKIAQNQLHAVHRSTSLDSLANSEVNHSDQDSQDSWCDISDDVDSDTLSNCDSITDSKERDSDGLYETYSIEATKTHLEKPIITKLVKKKPVDKLCDRRDSELKHFEPQHFIDDCAPSSGISTADDNPKPTVSDESVKPKESTPNAPFILNKNRRTSVASSGSVSRMETIVEEPIEPKISVKEILARFETLTSIEVCFRFYNSLVKY